MTEPIDHAPDVPGEFGLDADPATGDDSLAASVEQDPVDIAEPPDEPGEDQP